MKGKQTENMYIKGLLERSRKAQEWIEFASQETVDSLCEQVAWATVQEDFVRDLARKAAEETGMGSVPDKEGKMRVKVRGTLYDMKGKRSVGVIEELPEAGLIKMAKPVGVIGALIPCTNCEATPVVKTMAAFKTRNSIILAPHPRSRETNKMVTERMREALRKAGAPEDLVIHTDEVSMENSQELMRTCDLILATGGGGLVKAAYTSGTPAFGVGAGNAVIIVDETAHIGEAARKVQLSKTFDRATSCSAENACLIAEEVYHDFLDALQQEGGCLLNDTDKKKLEDCMWPDGHTLNRNIVAQPVEKIAALAGIHIPDGTSFLFVQEDRIGEGFPFSGEKLSVVTAVYKWKKFDEAVDMVNEITHFSGPGHSCGIHTDRKDRIMKLAERARVSRLIVNQPQCLANSGAWTNGMPMTMTLGCGTWGGNISSENITWKHLMNTLWISSPTPSHKPEDEELFTKAVRGIRW